MNKNIYAYLVCCFTYILYLKIGLREIGSLFLQFVERKKLDYTFKQCFQLRPGHFSSALPPNISNGDSVADSP